MTCRAHPPFRADHVGSLLRLQRLLDAREQKKRGQIDAAALRKLEDGCVREVVKLQEDGGLRWATDGEFRRTFWHLDFLEQFTNVTVVPPSVKASFHTEEGDLEFMPPGIRVDGRLGHPKGIMTEDYAFLKTAVKTAVPKVCIPSPSTVHFRGGRQAISEQAYPDIAEVYDHLGRIYSEEVTALTKRGLTYLQLDEGNFAYLCAPKRREQMRAIAEGPETLH